MEIPLEVRCCPVPFQAGKSWASDLGSEEGLEVPRGSKEKEAMLPQPPQVPGATYEEVGGTKTGPLLEEERAPKEE